MALLEGLGFGESPRWHDGRLWLCNWGTQEVLAVTPDGRADVVARIPTTIPYSIDWLPDGELLVVSGQEAKVLRGDLTVYADLTPFGDVFNEIVVDGRGNAYVNGSSIVLVQPDTAQRPTDRERAADGEKAIDGERPAGVAREVARDIRWGNGMVVTPDNATLIVAESHGNCLTAFDIADDGALSNRRVWADLGDKAFPDGICLDAEGAVWYADVPNKHCVRVREGGEVLDTVSVDRGCFACMLGGNTLYIVAAHWRGMEHIHEGDRTGILTSVPAPAAAAGWPKSA